MSNDTIRALTIAATMLALGGLVLTGPSCDSAESDPGPCVGVPPPNSAYGAEPGPSLGTGGSQAGGGGNGSAAGGSAAGGSAAGGGAAQLNPKDEGAPLPVYQLDDFQPRSCGYQATYGLQVPQGQVTVVALLAGWCGYCQSQASYLDQLRKELEVSGKSVQFLAVNKHDAVVHQEKLTARCSFPLLQDVPEVNAWTLHHGGKKDDIYVYGSDGKLSAFLRMTDTVNTNLSTQVGYQTIITAILEAP